MDIDYFNKLRIAAINNVDKEKEFDNLDDIVNYIHKWFRDKYNLCKTDPRYLAMETDDIIIEYYEDYYSDPKRANDIIAFKRGFATVEEMEEADAKKDMGDDYSEIVNINDELEEEILEDFTKDEK